MWQVLSASNANDIRAPLHVTENGVTVQGMAQTTPTRHLHVYDFQVDYAIPAPWTEASDTGVHLSWQG